MKLKKMTFIFSFLFIYSQSEAIPQSHDMEITNSIFGAGEFLIPCQVENQNNSCKIDTGAPISIFSNVAPADQIMLINKISYMGVSGQTSTCDFLESNTDIIFAGVQIQTPVYLNCLSNKNLIGLNHLMTTPFQMDFKNKKFTSNFESAIQIQDKKSYFTDKSGHIFIEIEIYKREKEKKIIAMIDTGAALTVVNKKLVLESQEFFTILNGQTFESLTDTHSNTIQNTTAMVNGIRFDNISIGAPYVLAIDFTSLIQEVGFQVDMIIGANVLKEINTLSIDPENKTYIID